MECCRQDTKEAMICINNKYGLIKFTNFYQMNHNFSYFPTKKSYVTGSILNLEVVLLPILHTLMPDALSSFYVRIRNKLDSELTEKRFSLYIIKELLNWYWWIFTLVGFKMHPQDRAFKQPTRANNYQYQFNNPIILNRMTMTAYTL